MIKNTKLKKFFLINFLLILILLPNSSFAEVWVCSYENYDNETVTRSYIRRDDGKFVTFIDEYEFILIKTFEDDNYLHLVLSFGKFLDAKVINKITKKVESVGIQEAESQVVDKIYGTCKVR